VLDNETGIVLPLAATAEDFVTRIKELIDDPGRYETMSRNARRRYEQSANWGVWAQTILQLALTGIDEQVELQRADLPS
jgi:glycosyltransferase involved in cell wall biosynthesis